jgi:hypothetical protein
MPPVDLIIMIVLQRMKVAMSLFTRRQVWTTGLLVVLITMMCVVEVLVNVQGAQAKSLSPRTPSSYYVDSFREIADGTPYTLDAREYPTFQGDSANSTMTIPQVDAYDPSGHFEWNMWGQFGESTINGVRYANIEFFTSGPQAPGNLIETVRWYPPIPSGFTSGCTLEGPVFEDPSGSATAPASCNGAFDQILYDPLARKLDHSFVGSPAEEAFTTSLENQRGSIDNIINHATTRSASIDNSSNHAIPESASIGYSLAIGLGLTIAGLALVLSGHVLQNVISNKAWAKIVGGIMADIGTAAIIGGGLVLGPIVASYVTGNVESVAVSTELADLIAQRIQLSQAQIQAAEIDYSDSLRLLFRQ